MRLPNRHGDVGTDAQPQLAAQPGGRLAVLGQRRRRRLSSGVAQGIGKHPVHDQRAQRHGELAQLAAEVLRFSERAGLERADHHEPNRGAAQQAVHRPRPLLHTTVQLLQLAPELADLTQHLATQQAVGQVQKRGGREVHRPQAQP